MRRFFIILLCAAAVLCSGCDVFRKLAGRPTSADIEARRAAIEAVQEAEHQARMDSLAKVEKQLADSLAVLDSLKNMNETMLEPKSMGGLESGGADTSLLPDTRLFHGYRQCTISERESGKGRLSGDIDKFQERLYRRGRLSCGQYCQCL